MTDHQMTQTAGRPARRKRPHPARNARIASAALGLTTMFGLVGVMGLVEATAGTLAASPAPVVVITQSPISPASPSPIPVVSTRPTVAPAPPTTAAPVVSSHGSR